MKNSIIECYQNSCSHIDIGMSKDIQEFFCNRKEIKAYTLKKNEENIIVINVCLIEYSKITAKKLFMDFYEFVSYGYADLFSCIENKQEIKYLYMTQNESFGVKIEIVIS